MQVASSTQAVAENTTVQVSQPHNENDLEKKIEDAVKRQLPESVKLELSKCANLSDLLLTAAKKDDTSRVEALVKYDIDIDVIEDEHYNRLYEQMLSNKKTPLWYACRNGNIKMMHTLIEAGANVKKGDPIDIAAYVGNLEAVRCLWEKGVRRFKYTAAIKGRSVTIVKFLLKRTDLNARQKMNWIRVAIEENSPEILALLVPPSNKRKPFLDGYLDRHFSLIGSWRATAKVNSEIVNVLYEGGGRITEGCLVISLALNKEYVVLGYRFARNIEQVISALVKEAEVIDLNSDFCRKFFHRAILQGWGEVVRTLVDRGFNVSFTDLLHAYERGLQFLRDNRSEVIDETQSKYRPDLVYRCVRKSYEAQIPQHSWIWQQVMRLILYKNSL